MDKPESRSGDLERVGSKKHADVSLDGMRPSKSGRNGPSSNTRRLKCISILVHQVVEATRLNLSTL